VLCRRFVAILLLLFATGNAAAPIHPDSPVGREVFNRCLASAETAWRGGRTAEALRWYHSAKQVARAHNLTLTDRDSAFAGLIARHEAGLAGPQPGRKPGCETDGSVQQPAGPTTPQPPVRRIASGSQVATLKIIPPLQPQVVPFPKSSARTIPGDAAPAQSPSPTVPDPSPEPALAANQPDEPAVAQPATVPSDTPEPATEDTLSPVPIVGGEPSPSQEPAPPIWPDSESTADPEADAEDGLVPPVSPPRTSAPPAPPQPPRDTEDPQTSSTDTIDSPKTPVATASVTNPNAIKHPVRLTADQRAVPIQRPTSPPPTASPTSDEATSTPLSQEFLGSFDDQQLILALFGPIVVALIILGLMTQEMSGPLRILAWIRRRVRRSGSPDHAHADEVSAESTPETPETPETLADGQIGQVLLTVRFGTRRRNKVDFYTATIDLPGLEPTRVVKRRDGSPLFHSKGAAANSARHLARRLGFDGIVAQPARRQAA